MQYGPLACHTRCAFQSASPLSALSIAQRPPILRKSVLGLRFAHLEELEESKRFAPSRPGYDQPHLKTPTFQSKEEQIKCS
jgi:hypothetical protein